MNPAFNWQKHVPQRLLIKPVQGTNADVCTRRSCEDPELHVGFRVRELHTKFDTMRVLGSKSLMCGALATRWQCSLFLWQPMFVLVFVSCCAERLRSIDVQLKLTTTSSVEFASVNLKRFPWFRLGAPLHQLCDRPLSLTTGSLTTLLLCCSVTGKDPTHKCGACRVTPAFVGEVSC